jgi:hypothetical protein
VGLPSSIPRVPLRSTGGFIVSPPLGAQTQGTIGFQPVDATTGQRPVLPEQFPGDPPGRPYNLRFTFLRFTF